MAGVAQSFRALDATSQLHTAEGSVNWPLVIALTAATIVMMVAAALAFRRLWLMRLTGSFDCYLRLDSGKWAAGVARYSTDSLTWYRLVAFGTSGRAVNRRRLALESVRPPEPGEELNLLTGAMVVTCRSEGVPLTLAMSREASMGLSSWIESVPPGTSPHIT